MSDGWIMRAWELLDPMDSIFKPIRNKPMNTRTRKTIWKERRRRANLPRSTKKERRRKVKHTCKTCEHFECEVRYGSGEPLDSVGNCSLRADNAPREADDWCQHYAVAEWAEEAEGGAE